MRLARELRAHGAPEDFARRAERAADDERRHARMMMTLAGIDHVDAFEPSMRVRSLADVALENAVEGCVRETYAALVAHHQARHAASPRVRAVMKRIAEDETQHAELAHDVNAWARACLPQGALEALDAAARRAIDELESASTAPFSACISTLRRLVWS